MLLSRGEILDDMRIFANYSSTGIGRDLRVAYFDGLNNVQRFAVWFDRGEPRPALTFDVDEGRTAAILDSLMLAEDMTGVDRPTAVSRGVRELVSQRVAEGLEIISGYDEEARATVVDLVGEVIVADSPYVAGSFWQLLGAIWMSPTASWKPKQYAETLLHEGTHQATFLHDMVRGLFARPAEVLAAEEGLVISPIRKVRRPYDASFHAAVVSATLIDFFRSLGDRDVSTELLRPLIETLDQLEAKRYLLSDAGVEMLDRMMSQIAASAGLAGTSAAVAG